MTPASPHSPNRISIAVDRDLEPIIPIFLENRRKDVQTLRASVAGQDFDTIGILGHRMKGDGGGYGFDAISEIGGAIEQAVSRRDSLAIEQLATRLADFLERLTVLYR
jgi:HPt (histidine-containing phosphotransfer) domain-containing protein